MNPAKPWLADLVAGLAVAGLLLPEAVAYASIAGLPPQAGVVGLLAGLSCYGLLGRSRFAIVSATSSSAAVLAAASASLAADPVQRLVFAVAMTLAAGVLFLVAAAGRFGSLSDFIARPVLRGFSFGLALVIIIRQLPKIGGLALHNSNPLPMAWELVTKLPHANPWGVATGALALLLLRLGSRFQQVPAALVVIALGVAASQWFGLARHGVAMVGHFELALHAPAWPSLAFASWMQTGELAFALVLVLYAESFSAIRGSALSHGDAFEPNRDLLALGAANVVSGLFQGMPVGAGYSATAANVAAGATTRVAGGFAALAVLVIVLAFLPWLAQTPEPVLAAIVIHAMMHSLNPAIFRPYFRWHRDRILVLVAVFAVLLLGVLPGLLAGIAVSLALMLRRLAETRISVLGQLGNGHDYVSLRHYPQAHPRPGLLIVRPETQLFFANADRMMAQLTALVREQPGVRCVVLSLEESPDLDSTSIEAVRDLAARMQSSGHTLLLARLKEPARHALLRAAIPGLDAERTGWLSVDDAVNAALALKDFQASGH